jgi:hypothetical protein
MAAASQNDPPPWYSLVKGSDIWQGDIVSRCPIINPLSIDDLDKEAIGTVQVSRQTGIVMSQSCDLEVRKNGKPKIEQVILCPVYDKAQVDKTSGFDNQKWEDMRRGYLPRYHLLNRCEIVGHKSDFCLIDLANVFSLPFKVVEQICEREKDRIRLNSPYREHMAQAFSRFFMRVGLPVDIPPFA